MANQSLFERLAGSRVTADPRSRLMYMLMRNLPLTRILTQAEIERDKASGAATFYMGASLSGKQLDNAVNAVIGALTREDVRQVLAEEWEIIPPLMRMRITEVCNGPRRSGNHWKAIRDLDDRLKGKILRQADQGPTERVLVGGENGKARAERRRINPAISGAERAFASVSSGRPADYDKWAPGKKRRWNEEQAKLRRGR